MAEQLTKGEEERLAQSADFLVARVLLGKDVAYPAYWTPSLVAWFEGLMATPQGWASLATYLLGSGQRIRARQGGRA